MANACDDEGSLFFFSKVILPSNFYGKLRAANNQRDTRQVPPYRLTTKNGLYGVSFIKKKKSLRSLHERCCFMCMDTALAEGSLPQNRHSQANMHRAVSKPPTFS